MKELYINNKRLIISDDTYFPFTQTISNLDDVSIIGMMASKSINIPRCQQNDEIFGYIAQINHMVISDVDNKIGISFNQTKKASYILLDNSVKISEGIIRITNITETEYTIELYDKLIEILEDFEGNDLTNTGFLSELDLILSGDTTFSLQSTAKNIKNQLSTTTSEVKPCFNIREYDSTGSDVMVMYVPTSGFAYAKTTTLPSEITPIQFRTLKNWELEYAVPLSTIFRSINKKYDNIIEIDDELIDLFNDVHFNMGQPKGLTTKSIFNSFGGTLGAMGNDDPYNRSWGPIHGNTSFISELAINSGSTIPPTTTTTTTTGITLCNCYDIYNMGGGSFYFYYKDCSNINRSIYINYGTTAYGVQISSYPEQVDFSVTNCSDY